MQEKINASIVEVSLENGVPPEMVFFSFAFVEIVVVVAVAVIWSFFLI